MKYIGSASAVFLLSALLLSGCNAGRPAVPAKTAAVEEENTQKEKAPALQAARLGDTLDIWTAAYGAPAGDTVYMKRFNNGTVTVIVFKEHIVNITLSDPAGPSKAPQDYKDFIPEDSILQNIKEEQDEKGSRAKNYFGLAAKKILEKYEKSLGTQKSMLYSKNFYRTIL